LRNEGSPLPRGADRAILFGDEGVEAHLADEEQPALPLRGEGQLQRVEIVGELRVGLRQVPGVEAYGGNDAGLLSKG
jgi:hypothetical protein